MSEESELAEVRARVSFGLDVQQFMGGSIGRHLAGRANNDIESAKDALLTVDPEDARAVRQHQNQGAVAAMFLQWLGEAVTAGEQAEAEWMAREG